MTMVYTISYSGSSTYTNGSWQLLLSTGLLFIASGDTRVCFGVYLSQKSQISTNSLILSKFGCIWLDLVEDATRHAILQRRRNDSNLNFSINVPAINNLTRTFAYVSSGRINTPDI